MLYLDFRGCDTAYSILRLGTIAIFRVRTRNRYDTHPTVVKRALEMMRFSRLLFITLFGSDLKFFFILYPIYKLKKISKTLIMKHFTFRTFPLITSGFHAIRRRHRQHVEACLGALRAAQDSMLPLDLAAEEFRIASAELGRITGAVDVEELLDVIFRDFCIGK